MEGAMGLCDFSVVDVGVILGCFKVRVAEQFLDDS
jgi:hypothetical protein